MRVTLGSVPLYVVFGMFFWSLLEYLVHRWLFHLPPPPHSPFLITMHFILHGQHHKVSFYQVVLELLPFVQRSTHHELQKNLESHAQTFTDVCGNSERGTLGNHSDCVSGREEEVFEHREVAMLLTSMNSSFSLQAPFDKDRLVFPPVPGFVFAAVFWAVFGSLFPRPVAYAVMAGVFVRAHRQEREGEGFGHVSSSWQGSLGRVAGLKQTRCIVPACPTPCTSDVVLTGSIVGYMCYDLTHYYLHHGTPSFAYFRRLKSYHVKHHFVDYKKGKFLRS